MLRAKIHAETLGRMSRRLLLLAVGTVLGLAVSVVWLGWPAVHAAGDASFSLSPASGTYTVGDSIVLTVYETSTSGDNVNAMQANLSYDSSLLEYKGMSLGAFTLCGQQSGGGGSISLGCAASSNVSGTQTAAQITFSVLAAGSASVHMVSGSDIDSASGSSVWDGSLPSATYSLSAPASTNNNSGSSSTSSNTSSNSGGSQTSNSTSQSSTGSSSSNSGSYPTSSGSNVPKTSSSNSTSSSTNSTTSQPSPTSTPAPTPTSTPSSASSTASLSVTIVDDRNKPIHNAKVVVDGHFSETTNSQGVAGFSGLTVGTHTVTATAEGKKSIREAVALVANQNKSVQFKMATSLNALLYSSLAVFGVIIVAGLAYWYVRRRQSSRFQGLPPPDNTQPPMIFGSGAGPGVGSGLGGSGPTMAP